jgi:hypothetical protein
MERSKNFDEAIEILSKFVFEDSFIGSVYGNNFPFKFVTLLTERAILCF